MSRTLRAVAAASLMSALAPLAASAQSTNSHVFSMVVSAGTQACLPNAAGRVTLTNVPNGQRMHVEVTNLPKNAGFDFFVIQVPKAPFGMSWYQGDIHTDNNGVGVGDFVGIFSEETFIVAPGSAPNKQIFTGDAASNPATGPIHTHHLGLWFNSPAEATRAGCPGAVTPFNGEHNAGVQVLNTANFADLAGPLQKQQ